MIPVPSIIKRLIEHMRADPDDWRPGWDRAYRCLEPFPDCDSLLTHLAYGDDYEPGELHYSGHPFEVIPLFWNGGDGLHYGVAWYDEKLGPEHPPAVSYAPVDDHAVWLGDNATDGLRNLLAWYAHKVMAGSDYEQKYREKGEAMARVLDLDVSTLPELTPGARSARPVNPVVPDGWRWVPGRRGIGTLAPIETFAPGDLPDHGWDDGAWLEASEQALAKGFPGTALVAARAAYRASTGEVEAAKAMGEAYAALGRTPLVERVNHYVRMHA